MVDVLDARPVRRKQRDRVMDLVDAQQRRIADPVAHPGVAHLGPEGLVAGRVGGAEPDVAESGDARRRARRDSAGCRYAGRHTSSMLLPVGSLKAMKLRTRRSSASFVRAHAYLMAEPIEFRRRRFQIGAFGNFECGGLIGRGAGEIAERVLALIGLEIDRVLRPVGDFEAEIVGGEFGRAIEVRGAETDVGDVLQLDHVGILLFPMPSRSRRSPSAVSLNSPILHSLPHPQSPAGPAGNCRGRCACAHRPPHLPPRS